MSGKISELLFMSGVISQLFDAFLLFLLALGQNVYKNYEKFNNL